MVEQIEVVERPEVARVLEGERNVPAITRPAASTVGLDEKVAHQSTREWLRLVVTVALIT